MRLIIGLTLVLAVMAVTGCQSGEPPTAQEDTSAAAVQVPQGWKVRVDKSQSAADPDDTPNLMFMLVLDELPEMIPGVLEGLVAKRTTESKRC